jgi:hypothetical protein
LRNLGVGGFSLKKDFFLNYTKAKISVAFRIFEKLQDKKLTSLENSY